MVRCRPSYFCGTFAEMFSVMGLGTGYRGLARVRGMSQNESQHRADERIRRSRHHASSDTEVVQAAVEARSQLALQLRPKFQEFTKQHSSAFMRAYM